MNKEEIALCVTALKDSADDLREGSAASLRLGFGPQPRLLELAQKMDNLRFKLWKPTNA